MEMLSYLTGKESQEDISLNDEENKNISIETTYGAISMNLQNDQPVKTKSSVEGIMLASVVMLSCIIAVKVSAKKKQ